MKKILTACFVLSMALFTLGFSGCDGMLSGSDDADGLFSDFKPGSGGGGRGQMTITGIDSGLYGSYRIYVNSSSSENYYTSNAEASGSASISGSSTATVDLYTSSGSRWNGAGSYYVFFEDSSGRLAFKSSYQISFTNGGANVAVSSNFTVIGRLTITGISSSLYGTYDVYVNSSNNESSYDTNAVAYATSVTINSSTTTGSTARVDLRTSGSSSSRWNGTNSYYVFIENRNTGRLAYKSASRISFTSGSANVPVSSFTEIIPGRLTITDISSGLYGTYRVYVNSSGSEYYTSNAAAYATSVPINSSTSPVTVDLYTDGSSSRWYGMGYYYVFLVDTSGQLVAKSGPISFSNGSANISASSLIPVGLTITGIDPDLNGISMPVSVYVSNNSTNYTVNVATSVLSITINNSTVTLELSSGNSRWNGRGSYYVFLEYDDGSGTQIVMKSSSAVEFVWGTATLGFDRFESFSPSP
jgi:hypothetical protein